MEISSCSRPKRPTLDPKPPKASKYKQLFSGSRLTPRDRVDSNIRVINSLKVKISSEMSVSYFFKWGTPQQESDHFKEVFKSFFVGIRGAEALAQKTSKALVSEFGRYADVARVEREGNFATKQLLEELGEIIESTHGLRQELLSSLQKNRYTIDSEWDLETRDTCFREFKGIVPIAPLFPKCIEALTDIVSKLLEIEWLNRDVEGIQRYTGQTQKIPKMLSLIEDIQSVVLFNEISYGIRTTKGDGSCALHALLGQKTPYGGYFCEKAREKLHTKIRQNIYDPHVQNALVNIFQGHMDAQNDLSSNMLFQGPVGQNIKQQYRNLKRHYKKELSALKTAEAMLWMQEVEKLKDLILENVDRTHARYASKSNDEIFDLVKSSQVILRNVIASNDDAFLGELSEEKKKAVYVAKTRIIEKLYQEDQARVNFLSQYLYPHYMQVLQNDSFYLNTSELELAARLFQENMCVINHTGQLITAVQTPGLEKPPVIICHEGVHFSRCTPVTEAEKPQLESFFQARSDWQEIQELVGHALIRDGQLQTLHGIENRKEAYSLIVAGILSIWIGGVPLAIQAARSGINIGGRQIDPENKDKKIQVAKMLSNSAAGKLLGGGGNLAVSLGVDLFDLLSRSENPSQNTTSVRGLIASAIKGIATRDPKKFAEYFMGGLVGEAANKLPENDKNTSHIEGLLKALAQNPELHGEIVKGALKKVSRDDPKPKTGGELTPEEQEKYPKQVVSGEMTFEQAVEPEMHDPEGYQRLVEEQQRLQEALEKAQGDLAVPQNLLEQEQQALDEKQAKVDKYDKKKGNRAYEKGLDYKEKRDDHTIKRNVAQWNVDKVNSRIKDISGKITTNQEAQKVASSPKHISAPNSGVHFIGDQKTGENHHPYYFDEKGNRQDLGKYDNTEDARYISGLFTKVETNKLSLELQCFDAQRQLLDAGFSIDEIPERPNFSMPTILGNNVDQNSNTLHVAGVDHKKTTQGYLKGVETLLGKPIVASGLSKSEMSEISRQVTPNIKDPKEHGFWFNAYRAPGKAFKGGMQWLAEHGVALSVNVNVNMPLYSSTPKERTPSQGGVYGYEPPKKERLSSLGQWENVQAMQREQMFERNMAYESPVDTSSQGRLDYQQFWGQGLAKDAQVPPSDWGDLGRNDPTIGNTLQEVSNMQLAGLPGNSSVVAAKLTRGLLNMFVPDMSDMPGAENPRDHINRVITPENTGDFLKSLPKGGAFVAKGLVSMMLPDMSDIKGAEDPKAHFNRVFHSTMKKYDEIVQIHDPNGLAARSGVFVGEMLAMGSVAKVIRVAEGLSVFGIASEGGFIGGIMSEAHETNVVAGVAFGFAGGAGIGKLLLRGGGSSKPLLDRILVRPQGFGQQVRMIEAFQQPALRSGLSFPKLGLTPGKPTSLVERRILKLEGVEIKASKGINSSSNHQFIAWVEEGQTRTASIGEMSHAGTFKDKGKEGVSKAGRALQKHAARENPSMPKPMGNSAEVNAQGQRILDEILNHSKKEILLYKAPRSKVETIDIYIPNSHGARFTRDGKELIGFLEPRR